MKKEVEEIIHLGKDSIVQLALNLIDKRASKENFTIIKVMTDGEDIFVSFLNPIKYLPRYTIFYSDVQVNLLKKTTSYNPVSNPEDYYIEKDIPFYKQTE